MSNSIWLKLGRSDRSNLTDPSGLFLGEATPVKRKDSAREDVGMAGLIGEGG